MDHLAIPRKLYGRDIEIATLLESFERVSGGRGEVMLVSGASGVGKTTLVRELKMPIEDRNGLFFSGKFDQYQKNIPYFAFRQGLAELCLALQSGDARERARFKAEILQAVGSLGQVLVDLVPEFESLLGAQSPLAEISPQEARHRFVDVFRKFLMVICCPEHPLVLFIDDWQWADAASFELLRRLQVGTGLRYLMLIVCYRDNEVDSGHPLLSTIDDLRSRTVPVTVLQVNNIAVHDVKELLNDTLKPTTDDVDGLAAIIYDKTLGNPFFVLSLLNFFHEINLIWYSRPRAGWQWRIDTIRMADLPGTVIELFAMKLRRLAPDSRDLLSLAACLGNRFDVATLSLVSGREVGECLALLQSRQARDMLLPVGDFGDSPVTAAPHAPPVFSFLHDRLQQAAYTVIEPAILPGIRLKIGRLLLRNLHPEQLAERLFEVANNLNAGFDLMQDTPEQVAAVELNLRAARKAFAATAYSVALQFYRAASRFLGNPGFAEHLWRTNHELTMRLFKELAECEFLEGDRNEAEKCIQQSVAHSRTALEKADALTTLIVQYTLLARYPEAIAAGRQALATLGIRLPEDNFEAARDDEISQVRRELKSRSVSSLIDLPVMSDPEMLMAAKILITIGPPCYRSHQRLWSVIVPKVVNLTLKYGNIPQVGYSHTAFGGLLGWVDNDYATAKEFGDLATRLMTGQFRSPSDQSVFYLMIGSSVRHWFKHLRYGTQDYTDAYEIGLRSGNLQYAAYAFGHNMYCRFYQGVQLSTLTQETRHSLAFSRTRLNQWAIDLLEGGLHVFGALSGASPAAEGDGPWTEEAYARRLEQHHNIQVACIYKVLKTFSLLVSGDHQDALALSDETEPLLYTVGTQGLLPWPEHVFARLLILTALYERADRTRQAAWRIELDQIVRRLRIWADNCPENFEHKHLLATAELARIDGRPAEAMRLYDEAIEAAQAGNFLQWEGMANERAYDFWLGCGSARLAQGYWQQAYVCYDLWGAASKVASMEAAYQADLAKNLPPGGGSGKSAARQDREVAVLVLQGRVVQLRRYARHLRESGVRLEEAAQTRELANAMQRVRAEIADRKKAEEALILIKTKLELALRSSNMGVWHYDIVGNKRTFDIQACALMGIDPPTFDGSAEEFYAAMHPDDRERIRAALVATIERDAPYEPEYRTVWRDGSIHYITARGKLFRDDSGAPQMISGIVWDISERKQAEQMRESLISELKAALEKVKTLDGLVPICAHCKKIRDDKGYWNNLEKYITEHTDATLTHGLCPDCVKVYFPGGAV